ncbi:MAG: hypothetical protein ABIY55_33000 [Kofleriaceae bacterium]
MALLVGCPAGDDGGDHRQPPDPKNCQIKSTSEKFPGYPYQTSTFAADVLPVLQKSCGVVGCHGASGTTPGMGGFTLWAATDPAECDFAQSFNAVAAIIDTTTPANSRLTAKVTGVQTPPHFTFQESDPALKALRDYVDAAAAQIKLDNPNVPTPGPSNPFDAAVFKSTIAPMFDTCVSAGCHLAPGQRGFALAKVIGGAQADVDANFVTITGRTTLSNPAISQIYVQAITLHASGSSRTVSLAESTALLAWITAASKINPMGGSGTCAPIDKFNLGTFRDEIEPILKAEIDLNNGNQAGDERGACTNLQCHGAVRGPGTLHLTGSDVAADLASFACFVDLASPSRSQVLACPTNTAGCPKQPHPGQKVFRDGTDLNYQKILGFLFGANAGVSPFDFAFYVRKLEPLFNDVNSVEAGARGVTCAETTACHGSVSGQQAPNGSNFPIIPNVPPTGAELDRLTRNFVSATQFTNFLDSTESSLFLYPSDEVADLNAHKFATGRHHPGGLDFAADSAQAKLILEWATGLRTDANGFQHNWLVAGNFNTDDINAERLEDTAAPSIFTPHAGTFGFMLDGWDGLFSPSANVDLNAVLPGGGVDHVAYAVSYVLNTQATDLEALLSVDSPNALLIYVDGRRAGQKVAGGGPALVDLTLKPAGTTAASSRITIKILQLAAEPAITFKALFTDRHGTPLTLDTRELVFTLGLKGGL